MNDALFNIVRPIRFSEVKGQDITVNAIKAGLEKGNFEHSAIFYGQTGGGKTTVARIVGTFLNCLDSKSGEPCCSCENCRALRRGNFKDYYELNAATNGGKDDIDNLIENVEYLPVNGIAKIFVIDEAHCLTTSAWKSLLKVLEEPPEHVYFILCTTNIGAIPKEILNRCGKYLFKAISSDVIYDYLCQLRTEYNHTNYSDEALHLIANESKGSMRDAVNNYSHIRIPYDDDYIIREDEVKQYMNLVSADTIFRFVKACCTYSVKEAIYIINKCEEMTIEAEVFLKTCMNVASDVITVNCGGKLVTECTQEYNSLLTSNKLDIYSVCVLSDKLNEIFSSVCNRNYNSLRIAVGLFATDTSIYKGNVNIDAVISPLVKRIEQLEKAVLMLENKAGREESVNNIGNINVGKEQHLELCGNENYSEKDHDITDCGFSNSFVIQSKPEHDDIREDNDALFSMFGGTAIMEENKQSDVDLIKENTSDTILDNTEDLMSVGNICFSDPSLANSFKQAGTCGNKADSLLMSACLEDSLMDVLVNMHCKKEVSNDCVTLATPFAPSAEVLKALINYNNINNVEVVVCEGLQLQ